MSPELGLGIAVYASMKTQKQINRSHASAHDILWAIRWSYGPLRAVKFRVLFIYVHPRLNYSDSDVFPAH